MERNSWSLPAGREVVVARRRECRRNQLRALALESQGTEESDPADGVSPCLSGDKIILAVLTHKQNLGEILAAGTTTIQITKKSNTSSFFTGIAPLRSIHMYRIVPSLQSHAKPSRICHIGDAVHKSASNSPTVQEQVIPFSTLEAAEAACSVCHTSHRRFNKLHTRGISRDYQVTPAALEPPFSTVWPFYLYLHPGDHRDLFLKATTLQIKRQFGRFARRTNKQAFKPPR